MKYGVYKQPHPSRKYESYYCVNCGAMVGMRDVKTDAWLLREERCKHSHEIDWSNEVDQPRPYWWLPETDSEGKLPRCESCARWSKCGRAGQICGSWVEGQYQLSMF